MKSAPGLVPARFVLLSIDVQVMRGESPAVI